MNSARGFHGRRESVVAFLVCFLWCNLTGVSGAVISADSSFPVDVGEKQLNSAIKGFNDANGNTDDQTVVSFIQVFKKYGKASVPVINLIAGRLKESDPLYKGRGPKEVERLRGYLLASLSKIGINEKVIPILRTELSFGYHPYMVAAAARVSGLVQGTQQAQFVPLLARYLDETYKDDYVDLDNYGNFWPLKAPTSVRLEAIESLSKIGRSNSAVAVKSLKEIAEAQKGRFYYADNQLILKAKAAIEKIKGEETLPVTLLGSNVAVCCANPSLVQANGFAPGDRREGKHLKNFKALDQNGEMFELKELLGKPFIFTFFYTRCDNPNKCSANVQNIASLKRSFNQKGISEKVSLIAISFDPEYDVPAKMKSYGEDRGAAFDASFKFLTINPKLYPGLVKDLGVLVNYGKGMVNHHGNQLYVFDANGKLSKIYENTVWSNEDVAQDVRNLLRDHKRFSVVNDVNK